LIICLDGSDIFEFNKVKIDKRKQIMQLRSGKQLSKCKTKFADLGFDIISHVRTFLPFKDFVRLPKTCKKISEFEEIYSGRNYWLIRAELLHLYKTLPASSEKADRTLTNILRKAGIPDLKKDEDLQSAICFKGLALLVDHPLFLEALLD